MQELKDHCLKWSQSARDAEIQVFDVCEIVLQMFLVDFIVYFKMILLIKAKRISNWYARYWKSNRKNSLSGLVRRHVGPSSLQ